MPYTPPLLIKPSLPPLRPPVFSPYRPPGPIRVPPTQPAPLYQPPDLLPPTDLDLKGVICIYSNAPIWETKKIRYRYPGENWQEIAGENYSVQINDLGWENLPLIEYKVDFSAQNWCWNASGPIINWSHIVKGGFRLIPTNPIYRAAIINVWRSSNVASIPGFAIDLWDRNGSIKKVAIGPGSGANQSPAIQYNSYACNVINSCNRCTQSPGTILEFTGYTGYPVKLGSIQIDRVTRISDGQLIPPLTTCTFKVFNIFNQEILSITRDDCPEVIVVPERCYFQAENERLVAKWFQSLGDYPLRIEYQGHCATVWKDGIIQLPPYPLQIYKECSDNPNCPPPRIRFDKKCEEKCEQCPPGTAIKVLLGSRIACVNAVGCVLKSVKHKPGCNSYDCICS